MNTRIKKTIYCVPTKLLLFLFGLVCIGGQLKAQQATKVDIRVVYETFDSYEFNPIDYFVPNKPTGLAGLEFLDNIDFSYNPAGDGGQIAIIGNSFDDACIFTVNSNKVGHGDWDHSDHTFGDNTGFYLFAVGAAGRYDRTIYYTTVAATKGETIVFGVWIKNVDTGYNMRIDAEGAAVGSTGSFASDASAWSKYSLTVTATATGNVTFKVIDMYGWSDNQHKFGLDDITVTANRKAIHILTPGSLVAQVAPETAVPLSAIYNNPNQGSGSYTYQWQAYNSGSWQDLTDSGITEPETGTTFTTKDFSVTSDTEGFINYRLKVTDGANTYYSDIITVEYITTEYLFRENFGGNWPSTNQTDPAGASGDWWITTGDQPVITSDFTYGPADNTDHDNRGKAEIAYGTIPIKLDNAYPSYAITKMAGWELPLPGDPENEVWAWGHGGIGNNDGKKKGAFYDHTLPDENSRGYFMYSFNRAESATLKTVYDTIIPVTADRIGQSFLFSAWQVALWGKDDGLSYQFLLEVEDEEGTVTDFAESDVSDAWEERELLFFIPNNYQGEKITLRVSSFGNNLWLGLDDISLTGYDSYVTITSPSSGSIVGSNIDFAVNYKYISSSVNYRWQRSANGTSGWVDLQELDGVAMGSSGTFITPMYSVADSYYYRVLITEGDNFEGAMASEPVQLFRAADYLIKEDFGGCNAEQDFIDETDNTYAIPGYQYTEIDSETGDPNPGSGYFLITRKVYLHLLESGTIDWYNDVTDHSECEDGYFLQVHAKKPVGGEIAEFYTTTLYNLCGGSKLSFKAWIANLGEKDYSRLNFKFLVQFDSNGESEEYITGTINGEDPLWKQYGFDFFVPEGVSSATFSILAEGGDTVWDWGRAFALDDIEIKTLNPVQIIDPVETETYILSGETMMLTASYACGGLTEGLTFQWQERSESGEWNDCTGEGATGEYGDINFTTHYTAKAIENTTYYRFTVTGKEGEFLASDAIKIIPQGLSSKTYFVCPDNMTDGQAATYRGSKNEETGIGTYFPGMVSLEEPGYLPSLIRMEAPEIPGVTYKWYDSEDGEEELPDQDEYERNRIYASIDEIEDPILVSDGKSHTFSVQNERNTNGVFEERTYWVQTCDSNGEPVDGTERVAYHLQSGYLCGSLDADVSTTNAKRIHREDFGGTDTSDPVMTTPPTDFTIGYVQYTDGTLQPGGYMIAKKSPEGDGWAVMEDHIYKDQGEKHGYLVAIDATENRGLFYTHVLTDFGDCRNIELVFTGWFASQVSWNGFEKANLKFSLTDTETGLVLAEYLTGNMVDQENEWRQFGFRFFVPDGVNSITLDIVNNNFGTTGGNDVVMDDIEIYLVIPPFPMWPLADGYVCDIEKDKGGSVTFSASYTDDGTLGDELSFRWEYSSESKEGPWVPIGSSGSVTNGALTTEKTSFTVFPFIKEDEGAYRIVIGPTDTFEYLDYECMAVSESRWLIYAPTVADPPTPSLAGNRTAFCYSDAEEGYITITNQDTNTALYTEYVWRVGRSVVPETTEATETELRLKLDDYAPGYYQISLTAFNETECDSTSVHEFVLYPRQTTWTGKGEKNNWNDFRNWDNGVPGACTHAIIPSNINEVEDALLFEHYPELISPTVDSLQQFSYAENQIHLNQQKAGQNDIDFSLRPACDTITFKMGGAVARTDYLNYGFAKVDLDVKPNRWYTLSAPLRAMYSGDYFVEGNTKRQDPTVYMMKYNTINPQTKDTLAMATGDFSHPFNTLTEPLYPGLGYAVWVDNDVETTEIQSFRFPKDSTSYALWNYQGVYMGKTTDLDRTGIGRFTYEEHIEMEGNLPKNSPSGFTVKVENDKSDYTTALVGNPFMSHLNFSQFRAANQAITDGYYIWTSNKTYEAYKPGTFDDDPNLIAPMQSFIVAKTGQLSFLQFDFGMSVTAPDIALRSRSTGSEEKATLRLEVVRDQVIQSHIRLRYDLYEENSYQPHKDMWTLFSEEQTEPAVLYALLDGKAASIRTLGDLSKPIELGIRTDLKGELTLRLSGMETLDISQDIYLEDALTGILQDMRANPTYTFENPTGNVQGRLFLRIGEIEEDDSPDPGIRITTHQGRIQINSAMDDPIESVRIHTIDGRLAYHIRAVRQSVVSFNAPIRKQVALVTVTTRHRQKTEKMIVK